MKTHHYHLPIYSSVVVGGREIVPKQYPIGEILEDRVVEVGGAPITAATLTRHVDGYIQAF